MRGCHIDQRGARTSRARRARRLRPGHGHRRRGRLNAPQRTVRAGGVIAAALGTTRHDLVAPGLRRGAQVRNLGPPGGNVGSTGVLHVLIAIKVSRGLLESVAPHCPARI